MNERTSEGVRSVERAGQVRELREGGVDRLNIYALTHVNHAQAGLEACMSTVWSSCHVTQRMDSKCV
jgi:translation elongation factor EF-Tu-like GTPase